MKKFLVAVLVALLGFASASWASDEIQVYTDEINEPGKAGLELHTNYVLEGRRQPDYVGELAPHHVLNLTPEFSYGVTKTFEVGLYLPFAYDADNRSGYSNGAKVRAKWLHADEASNIYYGVNLELGYTPLRVSEDRWNAEIRPIIGFERGAWAFAVNPILGVSVSGPSQRPEFEPAFKLDRKLSGDFSIGLEHYASLGLLDNLSSGNEQKHSTFLVTDFKAGGYEFNLGLGRGWRNSDEQWTLKLIIGGIPLGK